MYEIFYVEDIYWILYEIVTRQFWWWLVSLKNVLFLIHSVNKGQEWWKKVNRRFFRDVSQEDVQDVKAKLEGEALLGLKQPARQL